MKVKAKAKGFYQGKIIYPDEVFDVGVHDKATWFEVVEEKKMTPQVVKPKAVSTKKGDKTK